jgi:pimeloyl-ACP methyl ester carboxylesterase
MGMLTGIPVSVVLAQTVDLTAVFTIDKNTVQNYSYNNKNLISGAVKAVAVDFQGLSYQDLKVEANPMDTELARRGVLVIQPWLGPWNWSNFETIHTTDKIIAATLDKYNISSSIPLVIYGRSMGGVSAYNYIIYGKYRASGVAGNCPVTDLRYHSTERPDTARGIYRAFAHYPSGVSLAVEIHSPIHQINRMPNIPYFVVSSEADVQVNKGAHADKFVAALKSKNYTVTYVIVPGMTHCQFDGGKMDSHPDVLSQYIEFIASFAR